MITLNANTAERQRHPRCYGRTLGDDTPVLTTTSTNWQWHKTAIWDISSGRNLPLQWHKTAIDYANTLFLNQKFRLCSRISRFVASILLISLTKSALQHLLRQVCASDRPKGAKRLVSAPPASKMILLAPRLVMGFGAALCMQVALSSAANADGWTRSTDDAGWSRQDRFSGDGEVADRPKVERVLFVRTVKQASGSELDRLMSLIGRAEAPAGYDSVHHNAKVRPPKPASQMTLGEIAVWIRSTPKQPHAIGRYQVIPKTLGRVSEALGMNAATKYDRRTQDRIARFLIEEAGYPAFRSGRMSLSDFMDRLAKVWAGLPLANGRSAYHGYAGNRATISREDYHLAMTTIFPQRAALK